MTGGRARVISIGSIGYGIAAVGVPAAGGAAGSAGAGGRRVSISSPPRDHRSLGALLAEEFAVRRPRAGAVALAELLRNGAWLLVLDAG